MRTGDGVPPTVVCPVVGCEGDQCAMCGGATRLSVGPETDAALKALLLDEQRRYDELAARFAALQAEAGADELQRAALAAEWRVTAKKVLAEHWQTTGMWGGVRFPVCGRCAYGDGAPFLWPCPTRRALTGEAAPEPGRRPTPAGEVCQACEGRIHWQECPTGGWWVHYDHPQDGHDAATSEASA